MKDIQKLLNSTLAGFIAQKLDAKDGKDGKISASVWNEFAAQYGGKSIKESISVADAMNSITTYAIRESKKAGKSTNELATEWLDTLTGGGSLSGITDGTTPPTVQPKAETKPGAKATPTITPSTVSDKESSITLTHNIDYREEVGWTTQEVDAGDSLRATKHTKEGEADVYQMATNGINIHGSTVEEVRAKYDKWVKEFAAAPADESADNAQTRKAQNVQILKDKLEAADYSIDAVKALAADFRNDDLIDRNSDEYKSLVQNLLLTRNAEVIESLLSDGDDVDMTVVEKDKTAHEYLAGMYQEIRNKEKAGVMLSPEEIELKDTLQTRRNYLGYKIEADTDKGIHEKYMAYKNMDGKPMYQTFIGDNWYFAESPELLDEFLTKLDAADTDEKKAALFKEYINTGDKELAKCLARNAKALKASDEDIISLINANGLEVLSALDNDSDVEASDYSAEVIKSVVDRAKEICTTDKGNLENAVYLGEVEKFISALPEDGENPIDKNALRKEILGTYFDKTETTDAEGNTTTTYTFNPSRRPTYEEMYGLAVMAYMTTSDLHRALVDYIKLEDMGKGQYNEAIEQVYVGDYTVPHYAKMVEGMSTASDITDFIDNKVATDRDYHLPYDAIIAKLEGFSEDEKKQILDRLVKYAGGGSKISDENKLQLAKHCMQIDAEGNVTFDKSKLPEGVDARKILDYFLPKDCTEGDAKKYFDAIINTLDKSELGIITQYSSKNPETAKARIKALVAANPKDEEFILKVLDIEDSGLIPYDTIRNLDAAEWQVTTKQTVFEKAYKGHFMRSEWQKSLNNAVNKHLISHVESEYYAIGDKMYDTKWLWNAGADEEWDTADDVMSFTSFSKTGYENGIKMYDQLKGAGSGDIAKMLRSSKDEGYENFVTPDNVVGIIKGFNQKSPDEGLMEYIANENRMSSGVKPGKALCNRIPKALMREAAKLGLTESDEYKALAEFFGAEGNPKDETFKFTKNDEAAIRYDAATAKELDKLIQSLVIQISCHS